MKRLLKLGITLSLIFTCTAILSFNLNAQTITATISGIVTDANGAIVPGATVTATSKETGLAKTSTSNEEGRYVITFLSPGAYDIKVEKQGFAAYNASNVKLEVAQSAAVDIVLQVTGGTVNVEVDSDSTPLLQTESSNLETTVESKLLEELPSAERNIFTFVTLVPGTIDTNAALGNPGSQIGSTGNRNFFDSNFAVNGGRASTNDNLLDGVTNTIGDFNGVAISPPQDAIREFKVISGVAPAEYGRTGGGIVTVSSKAGTRRFHGSIYEYFQDGNLNANGWTNNRRNLARINSSVKHQFGGAIGGPIAFLGFGEGVPFINKLEKTFFFANYEARREQNPFSRITTVPTARMRTGDLSELLTGATRTGITNADGSTALFGQVYNPFSPLVNGRRAAFAGNNLSVLPVCTTSTNRTAACLDPVALAVLQYLPLPNRPGLVNNYAYAENIEFTRDLVAGRVDHTVSERQNFFFRFNYEKRRNAPPPFFGLASLVTVQRDTFFNATGNHVYNIASNVINNFRYGYTRAHATQASVSLGFNPGSLGFPSYIGDNAGLQLFPTFTIGGGSVDSTIAAGEIASGQIGGVGNDQPRDTHSLADSVVWLQGNHTFKFGGEYRLYRFYPFQYANSPTGSYSFTRAATAGPVVSTSAVVTPVEAAGSSLASFLLGIPSGISREVQVPITVFHHYGAGYFQDDWRVSRNLILNLGLRWDFETPTASPQNLVTRFDTELASPLQGRLNLTNLDASVNTLNPNIKNLTGVLSFPVGEAQDETSYNRFAPRIGAAYSINEKTTIRGGLGLFYLPVSLEGASALGTSFTDSQLQNPGSFTSSQVNASTVFLSNPFPTGIRAATGNTQGNLTALGSNIVNIYVPDKRNAYNWQWNLVLQRELVKNLILDVAYVGSAGRNLPSRNIELNQLPGSVLDFARAEVAAGRATSVQAFLQQQVTNPFAGLATTFPTLNSSLNGATIARAQLLRRFPQYQSVSQLAPKIGISNYHALQVNLQKRFSNGFSLLTNYVWSKLLDTGGVGNGARFTDPTNADDIYNFREEYSYSSLDVPHRWTASFTYELPFGRGKRFGKNADGFVNFLLGGWQISGSGVYQRGAPLTITNAIGFANNGGLAGVNNSQLRPNRVDGVNPMVGNFGEQVRQGLSVFDPAAFTPADTANYRFGTAARTYNDIRRDNYKNIDLSIVKNFAFNENRLKGQIRGEFLNAFNMVVFGTPVLTFGSTTFGQVTTTGNRPRIIQLVGRFTF